MIISPLRGLVIQVMVCCYNNYTPSGLMLVDVLAGEIIENLKAGIESFKEIMESINGK
jgi:hypothetical protein